MKRLLLVLVLCSFILFPTLVNAENLTPNVDKEEKIYDFADLLTDEEEQKLFEMTSNFIEKYNMDMVVAIINENPYGVSDDYTRIYSQDFYWYNGFGFGEYRSGIIFLIDMANRYPYITTRGNATLLFDDTRINAMHDDAYDYLASNDYFKACEQYINSAESFAKKGIPDSNKLYCVNENGDIYKCKSAPKKINWIITILVAIILPLIIVLVHLRKYKGILSATNANQYLKNVQLVNVIDQFLTTFTSRTRRIHDEGGSGGGHSGGGSSISHGSGGSFGGGGGRHF